jgi:hypothetical protein
MNLVLLDLVIEGMCDLLHTSAVLRKGNALLYPLNTRVGGSQS